MKKPRLIHWLSLACVLSFLIFSYLIPLIYILISARGLSLDDFLDERILYAAKLTLIQATLSTAISGVFGLPLGIWIYFQKNTTQLRKILSLPFGVPGIIAAFTWIALLGKSGPLSQWGFEIPFLYSLKSVVLAHLFLNVPLVALLTSFALENIGISQLEPALNLQAKRLRIFFDIIWPQIRSAFIGILAQVFCFCLMSFSIVLLLGGGIHVQTLETSIYQSLRFGDPDFKLATSAALWQLALSVIPLYFLLKFRLKIVSQRSQKSFQTKRGRIALFVSLLFLTPYIFFIAEGAKNFFSLQNKGEFFLNIFPAFKLSLVLGISVASLTIFICLVSIRLLSPFRFLKYASEIFIQLPSGISIMVIGLGFWIAYAKWINPFEGSLTAMILLQTVSFLPFSFRWLRWLDENENRLGVEAAKNLGANRWQAFCVAEWPYWKRPLIFAFAMVFAGSLGELAALSLFFSEKLQPFSVMLSRLYSQYQFQEANALSTIILIFTMVATVFIVTKANNDSNLS